MTATHPQTLSGYEYRTILWRPILWPYQGVTVWHLKLAIPVSATCDKHGSYEPGLALYFNCTQHSVGTVLSMVSCIACLKDLELTGRVVINKCPILILSRTPLPCPSWPLMCQQHFKTRLLLRLSLNAHTHRLSWRTSVPFLCCCSFLPTSS